MQKPPSGQNWSQQGQEPYGHGQPSQPNTQYPPQQGQWQQPYGQPLPGWQPLPPPKKKSRRGLIIGIIAVVLVLACIGAATAGKGASSTATNDTGSTTQSSQQATTAPATPTTPPTPTPTPKPLKWTTVQTFTGNGNKKTAVFSAPDDWKIVWSCDPASSFGGQYNLIVDVNNSDSTPLDAGAINTICQTSNTHDVTEEHQGGSVYLDVQSEGAWTIQVQELK